MIRDDTLYLAPLTTLNPQRPTGTNDVTGTAVDLRGYDSATVVIQSGAQGDTFSDSLKIDFVLQDSNDNSGWTNVTTGDVVGAGTVTSGVIRTLNTTATASGSIAEIGYIGGQRYVRLNADLTGTHSTGTFVSAVVVRARPHLA